MCIGLDHFLIVISLILKERVIAIPKFEWRVEIVKPNFMCVRKNKVLVF